VVHLVVRCFGTGAARQVLRLVPPSRSPASSPQGVVAAVERSSRLLHLRNCLTRCITAQEMLRRHGLLVELRIGVQRSRHQFAAHAWLEHHGEVLNDASTVRERYATFDEPVRGEPVAAGRGPAPVATRPP